MFRRRMSKGKSRKNFRRGAQKVNRKNINPGPMRGGIRL